MENDGKSGLWSYWALEQLRQDELRPKWTLEAELGHRKLKVLESCPWMDLVDRSIGMDDNIDEEVLLVENEQDIDLDEFMALEIEEEAENANGETEDHTPQSKQQVSFDVWNFQEDWENAVMKRIHGQCGKARSEFYLDKFEQRASDNWDVFYKRNLTNFFKDRHYLLKVFPVLDDALVKQRQQEQYLLEIGCGVGNTIVPLTKQYTHLHGYGIDFAETAISLLNELKQPRCRGFVGDVSRKEFSIPSEIPSVDFVTMVFVLSAIAPENMKTAVLNVVDKLKPGGYILFRDYGEYDQAQFRFSDDQRLGHNYYVRQDGTRSFFFTLEGIQNLFQHECKLRLISSKRVKRVVVNRKNKLTMRRVFINSIFQK